MESTHHLIKFPLLSDEEVANLPSRRDGVPEKTEAKHRNQTAKKLQIVNHKFDMGVTTWAMAVTLFNRFYARKSMKKNNTFVVACASLFLAGKINDEPKHHTQLANELLKAWYGKDHPQLRAYAAGAPNAPPPPGMPPAKLAGLRAFWTGMYAAVLEAERALLYTVGFDFNIDVIHTHLGRLLKRPRFKAMGLDDSKRQYAKKFQQYVLNAGNDIYTKDGMLVLQWPMEKVALAIFYTVFKAAKANKVKEIPQPQHGKDGTPWYVEEGLSVEECVELTTCLTNRVFNKGSQATGAEHKGGGAPAPSGLTTGAASTALLGACESVAYSGGGATLNGFSDLEVGSGVGEHTSVPRPLSSDLASGAKRAAPAASAAAAAGSPSDQPAKRARHAAPSNEATSAASHLPAHSHAAQSPTSRPPPPTYAGGAARPAAARPTAAPAAPPGPEEPVAAPVEVAASAGPTPMLSLPVPATTPADEDSEKEEGELEEGELA